MNQDIQLGERGKKISTFLKYGTVVAVGFAASFIVVQAALGLIGLAVIIGGVYIASALAPVVSLKLANFAMGRFIEEVWKNPVLTRRNVEREMLERIQLEEQDLLSQNSAVKTFEGKVENLTKKFPEDAAKFQGQLRVFKELLDQQYKDLDSSRLRLARYQAQTERVEAIWDVAETGNQLARMQKNRQQRDALLRIASDESVKAADAALAESQARLDHNRRLRNSENFLSLESNPSPTLVTEDAKVLERVK